MRIAIIDSGIHEGHPHVGRVAGSGGVEGESLIVDHFVSAAAAAS